VPQRQLCQMDSNYLPFHDTIYAVTLMCNIFYLHKKKKEKEKISVRTKRKRKNFLLSYLQSNEGWLMNEFTVENVFNDEKEENEGK
jgi:hypothetical protein